MFTLKWLPAAQTTYNDLKTTAEETLKSRVAKGKKKSSKPEGLFKQIHNTLTLLRANPKHPGLHTHEYQLIENPFDQTQKVFEAYAQNKTTGA